MNDSPLTARPRWETGPPLLFRIINAAGRIEADLERGLGEIGLSLAKAGMLKALANAGGELTLGNLAESNRCVRSNVTQLIDRMEADGLVTRINDPDDRRVRIASLTPEGRAAYRAAVGIIERQDEAITAALTNEERETMIGCLERIAGAEAS